MRWTNKTSRQQREWTKWRMLLKHALTQCTRMEHTMSGLQSSANSNAAAIADLSTKNDTAFKLLMGKLDSLTGETSTTPALTPPTDANYGPPSRPTRGQRSSPFAQNHVLTIDGDDKDKTVVIDSDSAMPAAGTA